MKKTFQVGQKVTITHKLEKVYNPDGTYVHKDFQNSWEPYMDEAVGATATVLHIDPDCGISLDLDGGSKFQELNDIGYYYPPVCLEHLKPRNGDSDTLTQVIVNTKGLARTMTQKRDALGRFVKGAQVGLLLAPGHVMGKDKDAVVVHYGYTMFAQTVTSINPVTGRMNCKTFTNDGISKFSEHTVQVQPK